MQVPKKDNWQVECGTLQYGAERGVSTQASPSPPPSCSHVVVGSLRQTQFSSSQFCRGRPPPLLRWLSSQISPSLSVSALVFLFSISRAVPSPVHRCSIFVYCFVSVVFVYIGFFYRRFVLIVHYYCLLVVFVCRVLCCLSIFSVFLPVLFLAFVFSCRYILFCIVCLLVLLVCVIYIGSLYCLFLWLCTCVCIVVCSFFACYLVYSLERSFDHKKLVGDLFTSLRDVLGTSVSVKCWLCVYT